MLSEGNEILNRLVGEHLAAMRETTAEPTLVMMSGLPGTGKSYLARILAERLPAVVVASDRVRKALFNPPQYTAEENATTHWACRVIMRELLRQGANAIYDATNLIEEQREIVYRLADRAGAKLVIVQTVAPEDVVKERLDRRTEQRDADDLSDADWRIYQAMRREAEASGQFGRNRIVVNTAEEIEPAVHKILRVIRHTGARRF